MRKTTALLIAPLTLALMSDSALAASNQSMTSASNGTVKTTMSNGATDSSNDLTTGNSATNRGSTGIDKINSNAQANSSISTDSSTTASTNKNSASDKADAKDLVSSAVTVVHKMKSDKDVAKLLRKAKGVYIVPDFGRGAFIVGGRGGSGVMLAKHDGKWTDPAFFDFGGVSVGAQAGGSGGSVAFILMSHDAVNAFKRDNQFSLNSGAGLSIVTYSANAQASAGKGDVVIWSNTKGAYAGATVSVSDVNWDDNNNQAFYGENVTPKKLIDGRIIADKGAALKRALKG